MCVLHSSCLHSSAEIVARLVNCIHVSQGLKVCLDVHDKWRFGQCHARIQTYLVVWKKKHFPSNYEPLPTIFCPAQVQCKKICPHTAFQECTLSFIPVLRVGHKLPPLLGADPEIQTHIGVFSHEEGFGLLVPFVDTEIGEMSNPCASMAAATYIFDSKSDAPSSSRLHCNIAATASSWEFGLRTTFSVPEASATCYLETWDEDITWHRSKRPRSYGRSIWKWARNEWRFRYLGRPAAFGQDARVCLCAHTLWSLQVRSEGSCSQPESHETRRSRVFVIVVPLANTLLWAGICLAGLLSKHELANLLLNLLSMNRYPRNYTAIHSVENHALVTW